MNINLNNKKVFVLHVKKGYEARENHINRMLKKMNIPFEYILDGDISDLTNEVLDTWFQGTMHQYSPQASCSYKHLLACKEIVARNLDGALILEDDIYLNKRKFVSVFNQSMKELEKKGSDAAIISYEDTMMRFVPRSQRKHGQVIYLGYKDRMGGSYYINRKAASLLVNYAQTHKYDVPHDLIHTRLLKEKKLIYYWSHPVVASQGSHTGNFSSSINFTKRFYYPITWQLKLAYKKLLYNLR